MRNLSIFRKSMLAAGVTMVFAAVPFSQAMALDAMSSPQSSSSRSSDESMSAKTHDAWITTKVKSELAGAKHVKSTDISVTTTKGVTSTKEKNHVVHVAKKVKGVKSVDASALTVAAASSSSNGNN
jgi:hyperosmotically inducible protein